MHIHVGACRYSKQAGRRTPPPSYFTPIVTVVVMQPCFLFSAPLVLMQCCWPQNVLLLFLLHLITSCVCVCVCVRLRGWGRWGHCVHVRLCTCIIARNGTMCTHSGPVLHALFILSEVSLEINPLHPIFNEGPKERQRERHEREVEGVGVLSWSPWGQGERFNWL